MLCAKVTNSSGHALIIFAVKPEGPGAFPPGCLCNAALNTANGMGSVIARFISSFIPGGVGRRKDDMMLCCKSKGIADASCNTGGGLGPNKNSMKAGSSCNR